MLKRIDNYGQWSINYKGMYNMDKNAKADTIPTPEHEQQESIAAADSHEDLKALFSSRTHLVLKRLSTQLRLKSNEFRLERNSCRIDDITNSRYIDYLDGMISSLEYAANKTEEIYDEVLGL